MRRTKHVQGKGGEGGKENGKREMEKEGTRATFGDGWRETTNERENEREGARIGKEVRDKEMAKERTNASGRWMERSGNEGSTRKLSRALGGACPRRTLGMKKDRGFLQQRIRHVLDRKDTLRTRMKRVNHPQRNPAKRTFSTRFLSPTRRGWSLQSMPLASNPTRVDTYNNKTRVRNRSSEEWKCIPVLQLNTALSGAHAAPRSARTWP